jgi:hypothetical protein
VRKNLSQIPTAAGVDGQTVEAARKGFDGWLEPMLQSIHRQGYRALKSVRRGVPTQCPGRGRLAAVELERVEVRPNRRNYPNATFRACRERL